MPTRLHGGRVPVDASVAYSTRFAGGHVDGVAVVFHRAVVLTSRPGEYRAALADGRLDGAAVIELLPVTIDDGAAFVLAGQLGP